MNSVDIPGLILQIKNAHPSEFGVVLMRAGEALEQMLRLNSSLAKHVSELRLQVWELNKELKKVKPC